jgi:hypothetical protein
LVSVQRLLVRVRQVRSRADELVELHRRLRVARAEPPDPDERAAALALRAIKARLADLTSGATSCGRCAVNRPWPRGVFAGGDCCSGDTAELFDDDELAALAQAGTRARDLTAPRTEHAGCAFRGAAGCTLSPKDRPGRCLHYLCDRLRGELHARGQLDAIEALAAELDRVMQAFVAAREAHRDRAWFTPDCHDRLDR